MVADGVCVGMQKKFSSDVLPPTYIFDPEFIVKVNTRESSRFVHNLVNRNLLHRVYQTEFAKSFRERSLPPVDDDAVDDLYRWLNANGYESLCAVTQYIRDNRASFDDVAMREEYQVHFGKDLSYCHCVKGKSSFLYYTHSDSLFCVISALFRAIISDEVVYQCFHQDICALFISGEEVVLAERVLIRRKSPLLYYFLFLWEQDVAECWWALFGDVATKSAEYWGKINRKRCRSDAERVPSAENLERINDWLQSGSLYAASYKRYRPVYDTDDQIEKEDQVDGTCLKHWAKFVGLTGGLWIMRCSIHGICIGFHIEPNPEGLNDPFSSIYCHFLNEQKVTTIDFACKFTSYAMRREPSFFKSGIKCIDELHGSTHVACSDAMNIKIFKNTKDDMYSLINDSGAEERNIPINKVKTSCRYFRKEVMMIVVSQILVMDNRRLIRKAYGMDTY